MLLNKQMILGALAFCILASCKTSEHSSVVNQPQTSSESALKLDAEIALGREMAGLVMAKTPPLDNPTLVNYVNEVGSYIAHNSKYNNRKFMFEVLNDDSVNAFACPGGYVFITLGAFLAAETESELAGILSHEIAHVGNRHVIQALQKKDFSRENKEKIKETAEPEVKARQRPVADESELGRLVAQNLLGPGSGGVSLFQAADASMNILFTQGLDHALEFEADSDGVKVMAQAGYEARSLTKYFARLRQKSLKETQGPKNVKVDKTKVSEVKFLAAEKTHPTMWAREKAIFEVLKSDPVFSSKGAFGKERFAMIKDAVTKISNGGIQRRIDK